MNYSKWIDDYVNSRMDEIKKEAARQIDLAYYKAALEFAPIYAQKAKDLFAEAAEEFYNDYHVVGGYKRSYDIKDIFEFEVGEDDDGVYIEYWFDPTKMTGFRNGYNGEDGLYKQVVKEGWHGGAGSGPFHPNVGKPYWRTPTPKYYRWLESRPAAIANESPMDAYMRKLEDYAENSLDNDYGAVLKKYITNIKIKI